MSAGPSTGSRYAGPWHARLAYGVLASCILTTLRSWSTCRLQYRSKVRGCMAGLPFDLNADGNPERWQDTHRTIQWNRRTSRQFEGQADGPPDVLEVYQFLQQRNTATGHPLTDLIDGPQEYLNNWFRNEVVGVARACPRPHWQRAWHGTCFESLYSILYHGRLLESGTPLWGGQTLGNTTGVYCFRDDLEHKVEFYMCSIQLVPRSVFWRVKLKLIVDRKQRVPVAKLKTDQWVQRASGTRVCALWFQGRCFAEMVAGDSVQVEWRPELEVHPRRVPDFVLQAAGLPTYIRDQESPTASSIGAGARVAAPPASPPPRKAARHASPPTKKAACPRSPSVRSRSRSGSTPRWKQSRSRSGSTPRLKRRRPRLPSSLPSRSLSGPRSQRSPRRLQLKSRPRSPSLEDADERL